MDQSGRRIWALAAVMLLAGCPAPWGYGSPDPYICDNGQRLAVNLGSGGGFASVNGGGWFQVEQAVSASGARYIGGGVEVWEHQGEISLAPLAPGETLASAPGTTCRPL